MKLSLSLGQISRSKLLIVVGSLIGMPILLSAMTLTVAAQSFAPAANYTVNNNPFAIALGDLNGDGQVDLVSANNSSQNLSVLLNVGNGSFGAKTDYDLGAGPSSVVIADFNSDTKLDVAATTSSGSTNSLRILLGNGNGTLGTPTVFALPNFSVPNSLATADFTGDGKPDFVVALGGQGVSFIRNVGDGTYVTLSSYNPGSFVTSVTTGDFNQDGKVDAACSTSGNNSSATVFISNGSGTFQTLLAFAVAFSPNAIAAGDFNGDTKPDLVTAHSNSSVNVLLGTGDGTFAAAVSYPSNVGNTLAPGDFDSDGKLDLAVGSHADFNILPGNGDGSFRKAVGYQAAGTAITTKDLNGDGKLDLITGSLANTVSVLINQVGPHTISGFIVDQNLASVSGVTVVLTGGTPMVSTTGSDGAFSFANLTDGGSFVVTPTKANNVLAPLSRAFNNLASSQITSFTLLPINYGISGVVRDQSGVAMSGVSVTASGTAGAATTSAADGSYSFPTLPAGGFYTVAASLAGYAFSPPTLSINNLTGPRTVNFTGSLVSFRISGLVKNSMTNNALFGAIVTLNGPEKAGISFPASQGEYFFSDLKQGNTYTVSVSTFQANALFSRLIGPPSQTFPNINSNITADFFGKILDYPVSGPFALTTGDYNGDGKQDFIVNASGTLQVFLGDGTGGFASSVSFSVGCSPGILVTADFNKDGKLDIAGTSANGCGNNIRISRGNGDGTFTAPQSFASGSEPSTLLVGDWDNDTNLDLATLNGVGNTNRTISILMGAGNGTFGAASTFSSSTTVSLAAGDMDKDGDIDLVGGTSANKVNVLYRAANGTYAASQDYPVPAFPSEVALADLNGDTYLDIVTSSSVSSNISVLLAVPNNPFGSAASFAAGDNSNDLVVADFNEDGKVDVASSVSHGEALWTLLGNGNGTFQAPAFSITPAGGAGSLTIADFNNDGKKDLAASASNAVTVLLNVTRNSAPLKITGVVTTSQGAPLSGVSVSLGGSLQASTATDASGNFAFNNLQAGGTYTVALSKTFYTFAPQSRVFTDLNADQAGNFTATLTTPGIFGRLTDANGTGLAGVAIALSGSQSATTTSNANGTYSFPSLTAGGNFVVTPSYGSASFVPASRTFNNLTFNGFQDFRSSFERTFQLDAIAYNVSEGIGSVEVLVSRAGDTSAAATVEYSTGDDAGANNCDVLNGLASSRCDYQTTLGKLQFAAGETSKSILIPIVDDAYAEGDERFTIALKSVSGGTLAVQKSATITVADNELTNGANPVSQANFFVRQHYLDFLNREPDAGGLAFWSNQITECEQPGATCSVETRRINVSAAFFLSIEFQETGYLVERVYKSAYGETIGISNFGSAHQLPVPIIRFNEFLPDTQQIGRGVVVGVGDWQTQLENNKVAFTQDFVGRARFTTAYPTTLTPAEFVDGLFSHAGVTPSAAERAAVISEFGGAGTSADTASRARALRRVAENATLKQQETNKAFVLMQYFGYLRRNPNDPGDTDYTGYDFWLTKLNEFGGNFVNAEMVKAFIVSGEYRQRFGQ